MAKKSRLVKHHPKKKKASKIMRVLEAVVVLGAIAAFFMKFLRGKKN